jgi:hypothetical protein
VLRGWLAAAPETILGKAALRRRTMTRQSKSLRAIGFATIALAVVGFADLARAGDKAKAKATDPADDATAQPQDSGALAAQDDDGDKPPKTKTKKSTAKKTKKQPNANKLKREKAAALADQKAQAAGNAGNQMPQQQPGMMPQGALQSGRGNNAYNNNQGMFMLMRQFDANGNGQLDPNELQNMRLAIAQMRAAGPEWTTMQYLQRFDTNGNGQLDPNEMQAAQAALTQGVQGAQVPSGGTQLPNAQLLPKTR